MTSLYTFHYREKTMIKQFKTAVAVAAMAFASQAFAADNPADLNDLEIAHVAYTADNIDIRYAHLALAISQNPEIHAFAESMIRDHTAVNEQALALLAKLEAAPQDNFLSQALSSGAEDVIDQLSVLRGPAFDKAYAANELSYHQAVNKLVGESFIPNIENAEVKALFEAGLEIFKAHEAHAEMMVKGVN